jgi:hypothetical protein
VAAASGSAAGHRGEAESRLGELPAAEGKEAARLSAGTCAGRKPVLMVHQAQVLLLWDMYVRSSEVGSVRHLVLTIVVQQILSRVFPVTV